jgi:hypothetical protein
MRRLVGIVFVMAALVPPAIASGTPAPPPQHVHARGDAAFHGSPASVGVPGAPVAAMAASAGGAGYWIAGDNGAVAAFGGAATLGGVDHLTLSAPVVGMAAMPTGRGYWLVARDGGVFTFGDASFFGSTGALELNEPIEGIAASPSGRGYWLVASDGGVFAFGDASFEGSAGSLPLVAPVVAMAATATGRGYWLAAEDGGVFAFGDARFEGSAAELQLNAPIVSIAARGAKPGYWLAAEDGGVFTFGGAPFLGAATVEAGRTLDGIVASPSGDGYWLYETVASSVFPALPAGSGSGRRIVYSNSMQRVWLVERSNRVVSSYLVSGRRGVPAPATYRVFSKSRSSTSGSVRLDYMVRFARGRSLAIGFHSIPYYPGGRTIQSEAELGSFRSHGCVRQRASDAIRLWDFAPIGTTVVVLR